ncbi:hypothetical protein Godav_003941 [Gossypium davidsonii]|uniref:Uncharacterized protein n=1 Tax=Gossypium davidsonii TaxID=34287 RepID=A0A7J8SJH9_GOSDV|nr:hypothetical protein [Gossypium davidsonii]
MFFLVEKVLLLMDGFFEMPLVGDMDKKFLMVKCKIGGT